MPSVIMARRARMSERSHASCRVMKLRLAASVKPLTSKSAGTPQFCGPLRPDPMIEPPAAAPVVALPSKAALWPSHGRAEASLPTLVGLYWRGVTGLPAAPW